MLSKKNKTEQDKKANSNPDGNSVAKHFGRDITEMIPVRYYEKGYFVMQKNKIMNIFEVQGKSYYNASEDELAHKVHRLAEYYRMQKEAIKIVFMNIPTNTKKQQLFLEDKLTTAPPIYRKWIQKQLDVLKNLEVYRSDRTAFLFIYADNENVYHRQVDMLKTKSTLSIKDISYDKKITVLRKLNNMNKSIKV